MKKIIFAILACATLLAASYDYNSSEITNKLGIEKNKLDRKI
jgi:hypothetical protein